MFKEQKEHSICLMITSSWVNRMRCLSCCCILRDPTSPGTKPPGYLPPKLPTGEAQLTTGHCGVVSGPALVTYGANLVIHDDLQAARVVGSSHQAELWFWTETGVKLHYVWHLFMIIFYRAYKILFVLLLYSLISRAGLQASVTNACTMNGGL